MTDTATGTAVTDADVADAVEALMTDGLIGRKGAFSREFVAQMREDVDAAFEEARSREGGAVGRGPNRWYVEVHPQQLRGFVELVEHPWVRRHTVGWVLGQIRLHACTSVVIPATLVPLVRNGRHEGPGS